MKVPSSESTPQEVEHALFGRGRILRSRWGGTEVLVRFKAVPIWLKKSELVYAEPKEIDKLPKEIPRPAKPPPLKLDEAESLRARRFIDSLRLGTVDPERVHEFIFGRDVELDNIDQAMRDFESLGGYTASIEGDYGTGKSHLLEHLYQRYLDEGYGVAKVEFGLRDVSPAKPRNVYREIVRTLRYRDDQERTKDFRDLFIQVVARVPGIWGNHEYFGRAMQLYEFIREKAPQDSELIGAFWNWLRGEATKIDGELLKQYRIRRPVPSMYPYSTAANIYCYLISALGHALKKIGQKGLVILLDEEERIENLPTQYQTTYGRYFLEGLSKSIRGDSTSELPKCGRADTIPYRFRKDGPWIMIFFGSATSYDVEELVEERIILSPLTESDFREMITYLLSTYEKAYPHFDAPKTFSSWIISQRLDQQPGSVRLFVKSAIESLDVLRWGSAAGLRELTWETA